MSQLFLQKRFKRQNLSSFWQIACLAGKGGSLLWWGGFKSRNCTNLTSKCQMFGVARIDLFRPAQLTPGKLFSLSKKKAAQLTSGLLRLRLLDRLVHHFSAKPSKGERVSNGFASKSYTACTKIDSSISSKAISIERTFVALYFCNYIFYLIQSTWWWCW